MMKRPFGRLAALAVSASILLAGCATVDLSNKYASDPLPSDLSSAPSSEVSSEPISSATSSTPSSEVSSAPSSVASSAPAVSSTPASSKPASSAPVSSKPAPSSAPAASKPVASSVPEVSSAPPPVSSAPPPTPASSTPPVSSAPLPVSSAPPPPPPATQTSMAAIEDTIVAKVNDLRASLGLPAYTTNNLLKASAYTRSAEMYANNYFEHTRPDGRGFETSISEAGYTFSYVMENIGQLEGYSSDEYASVLFEAWKKSPGHYAAMTSPDCAEIGVALYASGTKVYATQHFGKQ